ncbi:MAG TPA: hypothetical protein VMV53_08635 [Acidimicrobiales bacterium]|nr:hypothetical protein [Acidimicrobiales bacterium]
MKRAAQLRDEIALREASLLDASRERDAGDLSSDAYESIAARERAAIERLRVALDELGPEPTSTGRVRRRKKRWLVVALVCFALALGGVLWSAVSPRQAGNSITGSISLGHAQQITQLLSEAEADTANGNVTAALYAYQRVLELDASNVAALTQAGWLDFSAGSADKNVATVKVGIGYLQQAISLAPRNPAPRLYYAIVADSIPGNRSVAKHQFEEFLALKPSSAQLAIAKPFLAALHLTQPS